MAQTSPLPSYEDTTVIPLPDPTQVWPGVKTALLAQLNETARGMLKELHLHHVQGGAVTLSIPHAFLRKWVDTHHRAELLRLWQKHLPRVQSLCVVARGCERAPPVFDPGYVQKRPRPAPVLPAPLPAKADEAKVPHGKSLLDREVPLDIIVDVVARHYGLMPYLLVSGRAIRSAQLPRKVAMSLAKALGYPHSAIAEHFKCTNPAVSLAAQSLTEKMWGDRDLQQKVDTLKQAILDEYARTAA